MRQTLKPLIAELIGTFFLCFPGIAAIVASAYRPGMGLLGIAAAHGIGLAIGISATMHISGGHLNPAVTLGLLSIGKIEWKRALLYVVAQLAGATLAALAVKSLFPVMAGINTQLGTPRLAVDVSLAQGIVVEAIATFMLAFAVMGTAVDSRAHKLGGFAIGLTVMIGILATGEITGGAMNPARAFGPALMSGNWVGQVVYWAGPVLGAIVAMQLYERVLAKND